MAIIPGQQQVQSFVPPQQKKQQQLKLILGATLVITAAVIYFGFFHTSAPSSSVSISSQAVESPEEVAVLGLVAALKNANLDSSVLEDKKFQDLKRAGEFPLAVGEKGRVNPFEPF